MALIGKCLFQPESNNICQVAGVACIMVIPSLIIRSKRILVSFAVSSVVSTNLAPASNGRNNSAMAISKEIVVIDITTSSFCTLGSFKTLDKRLTKFL